MLTVAQDDSLEQLLKKASAALKAADSDSPRLDAEVILAHILGCQRTYLYAHSERQLGVAELEQYVSLVKQRCTGMPVAYLTGERDFYGHSFLVNPSVLVPREETECLVECALECLANQVSPRVLDLCTGSGVVAITLALEMANLEVVAQDISLQALEVARANSLRHQVADRVSFFAGDLFSELGIPRPFEVIVANPPYIGRLDAVQPDVNVSRHEPNLALFGGDDGLDVIRSIVVQAGDWLKPGGSLLLEIGFNQAELVMDLLGQAGFSAIKCDRDFSGIDRIAQGIWEGTRNASQIAR